MNSFAPNKHKQFGFFLHSIHSQVQSEISTAFTCAYPVKHNIRQLTGKFSETLGELKWSMENIICRDFPEKEKNTRIYHPTSNKEYTKPPGLIGVSLKLDNCFRANQKNKETRTIGNKRPGLNSVEIRAIGKFLIHIEKELQSFSSSLSKAYPANCPAITQMQQSLTALAQLKDEFNKLKPEALYKEATV